MERRIGDWHYDGDRHYERDNLYGAWQYPFLSSPEYPLPPAQPYIFPPNINLPETEPRRHYAPSETLDDYFSRLSISYDNRRYTPTVNGANSAIPYSIAASAGGVGVGYDSVPPSPRERAPPTYVDPERFVNLAMNNPLQGYGGGPHRNPMLGGGETPFRPNPMMAEPRYGDENPMHGEYFLHRKKELPVLLQTQCPIPPCSNRNNRLIDLDSRKPHFDGTGIFPEVSTIPARPQLYNRLNSDHLALKDIRGKIVAYAKDQYWSRVLRSKLENPNPKEEDIRMVLSEVIHHVGDLMQDQFGNLLIQKVMEVCNEAQLTCIIQSLVKTQFRLITICVDPNGTRAVQKLLELLTVPYQISMVISAIAPNALLLAKDSNGQHVIQNCLKLFSNDQNQHIILALADNCFAIGTNKSGCCVLQTCVDHSQGDFRAHLMAEIIGDALHLAEDPYGNYVVQHVIGLAIPEFTESLLKQLEGSYASLACNKYASNVVEKCLKESGDKQSSSIVMELLSSPNASMLLVDPYGNFVMQSALLVSKGSARMALINLVQLNASSLRNNIFGKKVLSLYDKMKLQQPA